MNKVLQNLIVILLIFISNNTYAQGGTTCTIAQSNAIALNILYPNQTTCGKSNNTLVYNGQDYTYYYCATQDGCLDINLGSMKSGDIQKIGEARILVSDTCYFGNPLLNKKKTIPPFTLSDTISTTLNVKAGKCYFILVDVNDLGFTHADCIFYSLKLTFSATQTQTPGANNCAMSSAVPLVNNVASINQTLCCVGNNDTSTKGNDYFYKFCPAQKGCLKLTFSNIIIQDLTVNSNFKIKLFDTCNSVVPIYTNNMSLFLNSNNSNQHLIDLKANKCYYIEVTSDSILGDGGCLNYDIKAEFSPALVQPFGANNCDSSLLYPILPNQWYTNQTNCCSGGGGNNGTEQWIYSYCTPSLGCGKAVVKNLSSNFGINGVTMTVYENCTTFYGQKSILISSTMMAFDSIDLKFDTKPGACYSIKLESTNTKCFNFDVRFDYQVGPLQFPGDNNDTIAGLPSKLLQLDSVYLNQTTCCLGNDFKLLQGHDWYYKFKAPKDGCIRIGVDSFINANVGKPCKMVMLLYGQDQNHGADALCTIDQYTKGPELFINVLKDSIYTVLIDLDSIVIPPPGINLFDTCANFTISSKYLDTIVSYAQTPGGNYDSISILNLMQLDSLYTNQTTCCMGDDENAQGQDWIYTFKATQTACITIFLSNLTSGDPIKLTNYNISILDTANNSVKGFSNQASSIPNFDTITFSVTNGFYYNIFVDAGEGNQTTFNCINYGIKIGYGIPPTQTPGNNDTTLALLPSNQFADTLYHGQSTCCYNNDNFYNGQDYFYADIPNASGIFKAKAYNTTNNNIPNPFYTRLTKFNKTGSFWNYTTRLSAQKPAGTKDTVGVEIFYCANINDHIFFAVDDNDLNIANGNCITYSILQKQVEQINTTYPFGGTSWTQACLTPLTVNTPIDSICFCCLPNQYNFNFCAPANGCLKYRLKNFKDYYRGGLFTVLSSIFKLNSACQQVGGNIGQANDSTEINIHVDAGQCYGILLNKLANACNTFDMDLIFVPDVVQQPGALSCANASLFPIPANTLVSNHTNCYSSCITNNTHNGSNLICVTENTNSNDYVYLYKPGVVGKSTLKVRNILNQSNFPFKVTAAVYKNCTGTNFTNNVNNKVKNIVVNNNPDSLIVEFFPQNPTDSFYIVLDGTNGLQSCFKYDLIIQQDTSLFGCNNADFELGNTNYWLLSNGTSIQGCTNCTCPAPLYSACASYVNAASLNHKIVSSGNDYYGGFPKVFQGNHSVKLGDSIGGANAEGMELYYLVDSNNSIFSYSYAVVLQDPGHSPSQQPFFRAKVTAPDGNNVLCTEYCVSANSSVPGFLVSPNSNGLNVIYKPWSTVDVDLSAYIGQIVSIKFENGDCSDGGHFGYSYIDCSCQPIDLNDDLVMCSGICDSLIAPLGYASYSWLPGGQTTPWKIVCPTATSSYTLNYTTYTGCVLQKIYNVSVNENFTLSDQQYCTNNTLLSVPSIPDSALFYSWNTLPTQTTSSISNLTVGNTYIVTITDSVCFTKKDTIIFNPTLPNLTITNFINASCAGVSDGEITVGATNGLIPYQYQINNLGFTFSNNFNGLIPGIYTLQTLDSAGCKDTITQTIIQGSEMTIALNFGNCIPNTPTTVIASITGGTAPLQYTWNGITTNNVNQNSLTTGLYTLVVTDANNCTTSTTFNLNNNSINVSITIADSINCNAGSDGILQASTTGTGVYNYVWNTLPIQLNAVANNLASGVYVVTVSDGSGCTGTASFNFTDPSPIVMQDSVISACINQNNGAIYLAVTPINTYNYNWINNTQNTSVNLLNISANTYTVIATNQNSCTQSKIINVSSLPINPIIVTPSLDSFCSGTIINLNATGASNYQFYDQTFSSIVPNSNIIVNVNHVYQIVGTFINGCIDTVTKNIFVKPTSTSSFSATICQGTSFLGFSSTGIYIDTFVSANNCDSIRTVILTVNPLPTITITSTPNPAIICNGQSIVLNASGATTLAWSNSIANNTSFIPTSGNYVVTGTDANGCSTTNSITVVVNANPTITIIALPNPAIICDGSSITLSGNGGVSYVWSNAVIDGIAFVPTSTSIYTVTGSSANNCSATSTINVVVNANPTIAIVSNPSPAILCLGQNISLTANGANTYSWTNSVTNGISFTPNTTAIYTVTGTDNNNCTNTNTVEVIVNTNTIISIVTNPINGIVCAGETVTLTASGANTITWNGGINNGVSFVPLNSGIYTVTASNSGVCSTTATITITVIPKPIVSVVSNPTANMICAGQSVTLTASGALNLSWSNSIINATAFNPIATNIYTVIGTDVNGCSDVKTITITVNPLPIVIITSTPNPAIICNGQSIVLNASGATTLAWSNSIANNTSFIPTSGNYVVTGTDANGCSTTNSITVVVNANPTITIIALPNPAIICDGSSITLSGNGGVSYVWSNAVIDGIAFVPTSTSIYTVTGSNANNCSATSTINVVVNANPTIAIVSNPSPAILCLGQNISLTANGANTYSWTNSVTNGISFTPNTTAIYTVTGTDNNNCTNTSTVEVIVVTFPTLSVNTLPNSGIICLGDSVSLTAISNATISWSNSVTNATWFYPTSSSIYTVTASAGNNCSTINTINIIVNPIPTITIASNPSSSICLGNPISLTASGATIFSWSNAIVNGQPFIPLSNSTYTVTGTSAVGCTNSTTISVIVNTIPTLNLIITPNDSVCVGELITLSANGPNSIVWSNSIINGVAFAPSATTTYIVVGTDVGGCSTSSLVPITVIQKPIISIIPSQSNLCKGQSIPLTASGAFSYSWLPTTALSSTNTALTNANPITTTAYTVTGINTFGCSNTNQIIVTVNDTFNTTISATICESDNYIFNGQQITQSGNYVQSINSSNGCDSIIRLTINIYPTPKPTLIIPTSSCINDVVIIKVNEKSIGINYTWNLNGGIIISNIGDTILEVRWLTTGIKTISLTAKGNVICAPVTISASIEIFEATAKISQITAPENWCIDDEIKLEATIFPNYTYTWTPKGLTDSNKSGYVTKLKENQWVTLIAKDENNCIAKDSLLLIVQQCCALYVPNAFTPNRDNVNDWFGIAYSNSLKLDRFIIYNRLGNEVFSSSDINAKWYGVYNGRDADVGTYFYMIQYTCNDGEKRILKGDISLIR